MFLAQYRQFKADLVPEPPLDDLAGGGGAEQQQEAVHQVEAGDGDQQHEPEPDEHVDLLVNHVDGQHAQRVVSLDGPCTCRYYLQLHTI